jgi:methylmalonic aciduria homocystinuria type C protein
VTSPVSIRQVIAERCRAGGLDLHAVTSVGRYNAEVAADFWLPGAAASMVVVVGNTRAIWPHVDRFVIESSARVDDPVDAWVERVLSAATADIPQCIDVRFSHEPPPRRIAIQRLAHIAGLAWLSPSHLCVHPEFGPWIALRAAVVLDAPFVDEHGPPPASCPCEHQCLPLLEAALAGETTADSAHVLEHWRAWLAVRDACPVGRQHRYSDEQIVYHYIGERPARWA